MGGRLFRIVKFRTMVVSNAKNPITVAGDSRITKTGAFLRRYKIDELPQLWNVLVGEMSFVGPRPDVPEYMNRLKGEERAILDLRPGITGPATLAFRDEEKLLASVDDFQKYNDEVIFPEKIRLNLEYIKDASILYDFEMILKTVF